MLPLVAGAAVALTFSYIVVTVPEESEVAYSTGVFLIGASTPFIAALLSYAGMSLYGHQNARLTAVSAAIVFLAMAGTGIILLSWLSQVKLRNALTVLPPPYLVVAIVVGTGIAYATASVLASSVK